MKTRKILLLILAILMIFTTVSMVSCSNEQQIKRKLVGTWSYQVDSRDGVCYKIYTFGSNNTYVNRWVNENSPSKSSNGSGTYEITDSEIILRDGSDGEIYTIIKYTFLGDSLVLIDIHSDGSGTRRLEKEQ